MAVGSRQCVESNEKELAQNRKTIGAFEPLSRCKRATVNRSLHAALIKAGGHMHVFALPSAAKAIKGL